MPRDCGATEPWSAPVWRMATPRGFKLSWIVHACVSDRGAAYRQGGWKSFDPTATPYTADQVRRERETYR